MPAHRAGAEPPRRQAQTSPGRVKTSYERPSRKATSAARPSPAAFNLPEGDLIIGKNNQSGIGTLVECTTRCCSLAHLPDGYGANQVRDRMIEAIATLSAHLRRSLTWDQGSEMACYTENTLAWQRDNNENTVSVVGGPVGLIGQA